MKALGIPPAWTEVWICPVSEGHLQATGRGAKGPKQYRDHPHWRARHEQTKYAQMCAFGEALPVIRRQVEHDLALPGLPRTKEDLIEVHDRRLARIVRQCHDLPGQELFQYVDDEGQRRTIDSADVNAYLR